MFMVEVYGKKACQINAQDPAHRRAYTWVNAQRSQCKGSKEKCGGKERKKKLLVPGRGFEPTTLTLKGKAPVCIATFILYKDSWLQLERKGESVIELNLKVQKTI